MAKATSDVAPVLSSGEWESLMFEASNSSRPLIHKLAVFHGAVKLSPNGGCPLCSPRTKPGVSE